MKTFHNGVLVLLCTSALGAATLNAPLFAAEDDAHNGRREAVTIQGEAVTGFNQRLGEALWDLGPGFGTASFAFVFGYNPDGTSPAPLTPTTPGDTLVASGLDPNFAALLGPFADGIDPSFINVPLKDMPVIVNEFTAERAAVPSTLDAAPHQPSRSLPNAPITLNAWLDAEGRVRVVCLADGTAKVSFSFEGLIENGIYTAWGIFTRDTDDDGRDDQLLAVPLGGVPNAFVAGKHGKARFSRTLGFCPTGEDTLRLVDIAYHADGNLFGGAVDLYLQGFPGITAATTQMAFPFNVEPVR
ncbi:MAG TPA: hypothetical protein ENJ80_03000 [Gammaproteobacteria bacterium]|nr:hypothetical protein [Gammaproteobacteria bacterium]